MINNVTKIDISGKKKGAEALKAFISEKAKRRLEQQKHLAQVANAQKEKPTV